MRLDGQTILDGLQSVDETTLRFSPLGFGGRVEPEASARFLAESIAPAGLVDDVPKDVRLNFERVRALHLYGLLDYAHFTVAIDQAHLALEAALRQRFVTFYASKVPVLRNGVADTVAAATFDAFYNGVRDQRRLRLNESGGEPLPLGFRGLIDWARRRRLLPGQCNAVVFDALVRLRNYSAHPELNTVKMPPVSAPTLCDVAEIINKLWGHDSAGGRLYPPPLARQARVAALAPDGDEACTFPSLASVRAERERGEWTYAAYLAVDHEELIDIGPTGLQFAHVNGFATTTFPCELLFGPGALDDLVESLDALATIGDAVPFHDRLFFVRAEGGAVDMPRTPADLASLGDDATGTWYAVVADYPLDAWQHVRISLGDPQRTSECIRGATTVAQLEDVAAAKQLAATVS